MDGANGSEVTVEQLVAAALAAGEALKGLPRASVLLSASADEATVRELAPMFSAEFNSHATIWADETPPSVIFSATFRVSGVEIRIQGSRPATAAETATADRWIGSVPAEPQEIEAALAKRAFDGAVGNADAAREDRDFFEARGQS